MSSKNDASKQSLEFLKLYKKQLIGVLLTLLTALAAICWSEYYIYIVILGLIVVGISQVFDSDWVAEHPIISFTIVFVLVSIVSLVAAKFWTGKAPRELFLPTNEPRSLEAFSQYYSGTIGSAIALAGAFVGIFLGATAFFLSKREQHREEMNHLVEKTGPAIKQAVKLIEFIHAQKKIFSSIKNNRDEAKKLSDTFVEELGNFFPKDPGEKDLWFVFLFYNVDETKDWYKELLNISKLAPNEIQIEVNGDGDKITLQPRYENYEKIVRLLEKPPPKDSLINMLEKYRPMVNSLHQGAWVYFKEDLKELSDDIKFKDNFELKTFNLSELVKEVLKEHRDEILRIFKSDSTRVDCMLEWDKDKAESKQGILNTINNDLDSYILNSLENTLLSGSFMGGIKGRLIASSRKWAEEDLDPDSFKSNIEDYIKDEAIPNWEAEYLNAVLSQKY